LRVPWALATGRKALLTIEQQQEQSQKQQGATAAAKSNSKTLAFAKLSAVLGGDTSKPSVARQQLHQWLVVFVTVMLVGAVGHMHQTVHSAN